MDANDQVSKSESKAADRVRDHLANERTFLAWVRTSLALLGLGFVLARMGLFLRHLAGPPAEGAGWLEDPAAGEFAVVGVGFLVLGTVLGAWSGYYYRRVRDSIESRRFEPPGASAWLLSALIVLGGLVIVGLVLGQFVATS